MLKEVLGDISAFGGSPIYLFALLAALILGESTLFWRLITAGVLVHVVSYIARASHFQERPDKQKARGLLQKLDASSFPSIHAGRVAALAIIFMDFFNNGWMSALLIVFALVVCGMRVALKRHYFIDVLVGFILGVASALIALFLIV